MAKFKNSNLYLRDNQYIYLGTSDDASVYFDGSKLTISTPSDYINVPYKITFGTGDTSPDYKVTISDSASPSFSGMQIINSATGYSSTTGLIIGIDNSGSAHIKNSTTGQDFQIISEGNSAVYIAPTTHYIGLQYEGADCAFHVYGGESDYTTRSVIMAGNGTLIPISIGSGVSYGTIAYDNNGDFLIGSCDTTDVATSTLENIQVSIDGSAPDYSLVITEYGQVLLGTNTENADLYLTGRSSTSTTGTVSTSTGNVEVSGSGTAFLTDFNPSDSIKISTTVYEVLSISSNELLTLSTSASSTASNITAYSDDDLFRVDNAYGTEQFSIDKSGRINSLNMYEHSIQSTGNYSGEIIFEEVGETTAFGELLYYDFTDSEYKLTDADAAGTMPGVVIALEVKNNGQACKLLKKGTIRNDSWNWSSGFIYASTSTGEMTQTPPVGIGDQVQIVGYAITADIMFFDPSLNMTEVS